MPGLSHSSSCTYQPLSHEPRLSPSIPQDVETGLFAYVQAIASVTGGSSKTQVAVPRWRCKKQFGTMRHR